MIRVFDNRITSPHDINNLFPEKSLSFLFYVSNSKEAKDFLKKYRGDVNTIILTNSSPSENEDFQLPDEMPQVSAFIGYSFLASHVLTDIENEKDFFESVAHLTKGVV